LFVFSLGKFYVLIIKLKLCYAIQNKCTCQLCCHSTFFVFEQQPARSKIRTGKVISNADKQPIVGATVAVKGQDATQTGTDGSFSISSSKEIEH